MGAPAAPGPRRRRAALGLASTAVLAAGGTGVVALGGAVPASAADTAPAARAVAAPKQPSGCRTPSPRVTNADSAKAAVERLIRRAGTDLGKRPRITSPKGRTPSRLISEDVVRCPGGRKAKLGDTIGVRYTLVAWGGDSATVDSSWSRGKAPVAFPLEKGGLIEGWVQGVPGMTVGSRRLLVVPPSKGYGKQGTPDGSVPANTTLIFVIDLVSIS